MKKTFLIILALIGLSVKAQYFQHVYGFTPQIGTNIGNGQVTKAISAGHLVGGQYIDIAGSPLHQGNYGIYVQRTDADGRFTSPDDFNNTYLLSNAVTGQQLRFTAAQVIEFSDGSGYGAIGSFFEWDASWLQIIAQGIAYIQLDANGNVLNAQGYSLSQVIGDMPDVAGVRESVSDPNYLFAAGQVGMPGDDKQLWAMRIDHSGNISWANLYDFSMGDEDPRDLVESPFETKLIIVGRYTEGWPQITLEKGFWMELDPATGTFNKLDVMSSFMGASGEYLSSIDVSNDPSTPGFILAGVSGAEAWVVKTYFNGAYHWSGLYHSSLNPGNSLGGLDVVGRANPQNGGGGEEGGGGVIVGGGPASSPYEYYVTGYYRNNTNDACIFKLDLSGNPINPGGLFIYDAGYTEIGVDVDVNTTGSGDGVSMYGSTNDVPNSWREIYVVKAYFNGVSGCNESFEDLTRAITEFGSIKPLGVTQNPYSYQNIVVSSIFGNMDTELCYNATIPNGSNARTIPAGGDPEASVSPNPLPLEAALATVKLNAETQATVQLTVYDMVGRQYHSGAFTLVKGENNLPVDLSKANMTSGLYLVKITGASINNSMLLIVK